MANNNVLQIPAAAGPPAAAWGPAEVKERLRGYVEVSRKHWPNVSYGTHVRYREKAGAFRPGGFVLKNPFDTKVRGGAEEKRFLKLQNGFNKAAQGHKEWIVAYEDIEALYSKADGATLTVREEYQRTASQLGENDKRLREYVVGLQQRTAALEKMVKRLESLALAP